MICKFTHPSFEVDFTGKRFTVNEENNWFNDQFLTKYSFPVDIDIPDDLDRALSMISAINSSFNKKKFTGFLQIFGKEHEAIFVIERIQGRKAKCKLRYGLEEFPNFNKKLSELDLEKMDLSIPMDQHALDFIGKTYPEVNYNFPQAIVDDSFDASNEQWNDFLGVMNNYTGGAFLPNEYDAENDVQVNRNIIQPFPYLLYIIKQGFNQAGFEVKGDLFADPEFKIATLAVISDFYTNSSGDDVQVVINSDEYDELRSIKDVSSDNYKDYGIHNHRLTISEPGRYQISGSLILRVDRNFATVKLTKNADDQIFRYTTLSLFYYEEKYYTVDKIFEISVEEGSAELNFYIAQLAYGKTGDEQDPEANILDLTITKVAGFDANGNLIPALIAPQKIDLSKCVPDITFGELLKIIKNWRNYDIDVRDKAVYINLIQNELNNLQESIGLEDYEVKEPERQFNQDESYLIRFKEVNDSKYKYDQIFIDNEGSRTNNFEKLDGTNEIVINGIPLPIKQHGPISTAHIFENDKSLVALVLYNGLTNNLNLAKDPAQLMLPNTFSKYWESWIDFRINSEGTNWEFICPEYLAAKIQKYSRLHAYNKNLIVRRVAKENIAPLFWKISLETEGVF